ncbi:phasin family protein [Tissierella sp. MSJ-40]|uniref:Phasin family protein n=1 Tax=Tissierella simiarum TaxID=2841534 RepID=A0ABS6E319_9FIRM|nr:phasin family protein [Tissierella simiarum]MBU5437172.1 phasin family protein [Tissierella simiarum]
MEDMLKNVFLAGIGTLALTYEKATQVVDTLVTKGKITVEQGKELNEELKRVVGDQKAKSDTAMDEKLKELLKELNLATKEDLEGLNQRISNLEKNI